MLLAPNRRRTRRRTSSVKGRASPKDYCSHIKLDGWKNAYLSANPDLIPFEGRGRKPAAGASSENQCLGFLHRLKGYILARVRALGRLPDLSVPVAIEPLNAEPSEQRFLSRFKAMEGLQSAGQTENYFPTIPDDATGFEAL